MNSLVLGTYPFAVGSITVTLDFTVEGSVTVSYGVRFQTGVEYTTDNGFRIPKTFQKTHFTLSVEVTGKLGVTAKAAVDKLPIIKANCYASAGTSVNCVARHRGAGLVPQACIHIDAWLYAKAGVSAEIGVWKLKIPWKKDVEIWNRNNSPARSVTHFEDGAIVVECSLKENDFMKEQGYNTYYYSSSDSNYANGGVSAVTNSSSFKYSVNNGGDAVITGYTGNSTAVSIPNTIDGYTVVAIGNGAFKNQERLTSVTIPANVTSIGSSAFYNCSKLKSVILSDNITTIGESAFAKCSLLIEANLPSKLTTIGTSAFKECRMLTSVVFPTDLVTIGYQAYYDCRNLKSIVIHSEKLKDCNVNGNTFFNAGKESRGVTVVFSEGVTRIPANMFDCDDYCAQIQTVSVSSTVAEIGDYAFLNCEFLTSITIPENSALETLGEQAFANCKSLEKIELPKKLESVGYKAFYGTEALSEIVVHSENLKDCNVNGNTFFNAGEGTSGVNVEFTEGVTRVPKYMFYCNTANAARVTEVTMASTVTEVGEQAFNNCVDLKTVTIPEESALKIIGTHAFSGCKSLERIEFPKKLESVGYEAFYGTEALSEIIVHSVLLNDFNVNGRMFGNAGKESEGITVVFSEGVTRIPDNMFYGDAANTARVTEVTMASSITEVGEKAFCNCVVLKKFTISEESELKTIGEWAFSGCKSLERIEFPKKLESVGYEAFYGTEALSEIIVHSVLLNDFNVNGNMFFNVGKEVPDGASVVFSDTVTRIPAYMFDNSSSNHTDYLRLNTVTIGKNVEEIGKEAFYNCVDLETVSFGDNTAMKTIGEKAFANCKKLTAISLPSSVTSVEYAAFTGCSSLSSLTLNNASCEIYDHKETMSSPEVTVLHGLQGSTLHKYAEKYGYQFDSDCAHEKVIDPAVTPKCEEEGWTEGSHCALCNVVFEEQEKIDPIGHKYEGKENPPAKCNTDGKMVYTCANDPAHTYSEVIKATGVHTDMNGDLRCDDCGGTIDCAHVDTGILNAMPPTCEEAGLTEGEACSVCGKTLKEQKEIPALGHADENKDQVCDRCGESLTCLHESKETVSGKPATCEESGLTDGIKCTDCGEVLQKQEEIPALGHKDENKDQVCDRCDESLTCLHENKETVSGKPATCEESGLTDGTKCTDCGQVLQKQEAIPAKGHTEVIKPAVEATCTKFGTTESKRCSVCKKVIKVQETVRALGHSYKNGKCSRCGERINNPFVDVKNGDWFFDSVMWAKDKGVTGGTSATTFGPNDGCTRGQVVTFLWAANGKPAPKSSANPFSDVSRSDYYYKAVLWAVEKGITSGFSDGTFRPNDPCTRAQVVTFLYAAEGKPYVSGNIGKFSDVQPGEWYFEEVQWAVKNGVTGGIGNGQFGPNHSCTRGQVVTFLYKVYGNK